MARITQLKPVVIQDDSLTPGSGAGLNTGYFYHPAGSNRLYILEDVNGEKRWVNVGGSQPDENNSVNYYVNALTGSDQNGDGSEGNPFRTLPFAYSLIPLNPGGDCNIFLQGVGPYDLPEQMQGVLPQGPEGKPLMICGDTPNVEFEGTVDSYGDGYIDFSGPGAADNAFRGLIYWGTSGASLGQLYQIAHNTSNRLYTIGGNPIITSGDTFQILNPQTAVIATDDFYINGPGRLAFWRCVVRCAKMTISSASVLFDACTIIPTDRVAFVDSSTVQFMPTYLAEGFKSITNVGSERGFVGSYFAQNPKVSGNSIRTFGGSTGLGYLISNGGIDTWTAGRWILYGTDINLAATANSFGIVSRSGGYLEMDGGKHYLVLGGSGGVGIVVSEGSVARLTAGSIDVTQAGTAAFIVGGGGVLEMDHVVGSAGNGYGVWVREGGMLMNFGNNSVTGTSGAVLVDPDAVATPWNEIGFCAFSYKPITTKKRSPVPNANYPASAHDELIAYTSLTTSRTVTLPAPNTMGATPQAVKYITVQDESGNASPTVTIVIDGGGAGHGPNTIENPYGSRTAYTDGTSWFFQANPDAP